MHICDPVVSTILHPASQLEGLCGLLPLPLPPPLLWLRPDYRVCPRRASAAQVTRCFTRGGTLPCCQASGCTQPKNESTQAVLLRLSFLCRPRPLTADCPLQTGEQGRCGCPRAARGWRSPRGCPAPVRACAPFAEAAPSARRTVFFLQGAPAGNADLAPRRALTRVEAMAWDPSMPMCRASRWLGHGLILQLQCIHPGLHRGTCHSSSMKSCSECHA